MIKAHKFEVLLAAVMMAKGTSFIFSKMLLDSMGVFNVLAVRFLLGFALLAVIFYGTLRRAPWCLWKAGLIVGVGYFVVMSLEMIALSLADSSAVALTEHTSIVMVPLLAALIGRHLPRWLDMASALLAVVGVALITVPGGGLSSGLIVALFSALAYSITIIVTGYVAHTPKEGLVIGILELGVLGFLALVASFLLEQPHLPATLAQWEMLLMLVIVCTVFGFTFQAVAQSRVSAERTGIFAALNPAVAALLGAAVLGESFGSVGVIGIALILLGITLPSLLGIRSKSKEAR